MSGAEGISSEGSAEASLLVLKVLMNHSDSEES
jgi:hypothetical protein